MASYSNMAAIKRAIQKEAKAAMRDAQKKDVEENTSGNRKFL